MTESVTFQAVNEQKVNGTLRNRKGLGAVTDIRNLGGSEAVRTQFENLDAESGRSKVGTYTIEGQDTLYLKTGPFDYGKGQQFVWLFICPDDFQTIAETMVAADRHRALVALSSVLSDTIQRKI